MKKQLFTGILFASFFLFGCAEKTKITNFEECVAAGNPVMESYPRQCQADGRTFVEDVAEPAITPEEALAVARES